MADLCLEPGKDLHALLTHSQTVASWKQGLPSHFENFQTTESAHSSQRIVQADERIRRGHLGKVRGVTRGGLRRNQGSRALQTQARAQVVEQLAGRPRIRFKIPHSLKTIQDHHVGPRLAHGRYDLLTRRDRTLEEKLLQAEYLHCAANQ